MLTMMILRAADVYEIQRERDFAWSKLAGWGDPAVLTGSERSMYRDDETAYRAADWRLRSVRAEIGGRVYRVPDVNLDHLRKRVATINRRAVKLGVEPVHFVVTDEAWLYLRHSDTTGEVVEVVAHTYVVVGSQVVKLAGWQFAATIEHDDEGNIIRRVPGVDVDLSAYRTAPPWCFHCETVRRRIDTFVVVREDGETRQVGRNCLVDFLGANAKAAAAQAEWLRELADAFEDAEDEGMRAGSGVEALSLVEFLTHVATSIRTSRWVSRGAARDSGGYATADDAESNLRACRRAGYCAPGRDEHHVLPSDEDRAVAEATIVWARETWCAKPIDDRDDFEHNMAVALAHDYLPTRRTGLAAYAVQGYLKSIEAEVRKAAAAAAEFVGTVGKRETFTVTIARVITLDGWGYDSTKPLYLMQDERGNPLKWFAAGWTADVVQGGTYEVKATVKAHEDDERYGMATVLTRVKVVKVIDEPGGGVEAGDECEGHPAGPGDPMGETVFCDGSCVR